MWIVQPAQYHHHVNRRVFQLTCVLHLEPESIANNEANTDLYHLTILFKGAYLADVLSKDENDFIKSVLNVINPKDGTDYWLGGLDADKNKGMQWISGKRTARQGGS